MTSPTHALPDLSATDTRKLTRWRNVYYFAAFVALGMAVALIGPALNTLAANAGVSLTAISAIFVVIAIGRAAGSLTSGWLLDKFPSHPIIAGAFVLCVLSMVPTPFVRSLWLLMALIAVFGFAINVVDVAINTSLIRAYGGKVGPAMNALHATFGIGGAVAPLLIGFSLGRGAGVTLAYLITALCVAPFALWVLRFASPPRAALTGSVQRPAATSVQLALLCVLFFSMVGAELLILQWTYNLGVAIGLSPESGAAWLGSAGWWIYAAMRFASIAIALRVKPRAMFACSITGVLVSSGLLAFALIGAPNLPLVWVAVLGYSMSISVAFPTVLTWTSTELDLSGKQTGVLFASGNVGAMLFPWLIGQVFESWGPIAMPLFGFGAELAVALAFFALVRALRPSRAW
jgi:fucose permease